MNIAIAGTGYVGLVTGVCLAEVGHDVTCVDIDKQKVKILRGGECPIYEEGLAKLMLANEERLTYTTDYEKAYENAEVIFIGVGTPSKKDGSANLKYVFDVALQIAKSIKRNCIIVLKSTVPIGTNEKIEKFIKEHLKAQVHIEVASNPEFLAQGTAVRDTLHAARIVIGTNSSYAAKVLEKVYENFQLPMVFTDRRSAEMIKYASNDFLALKVSYINEIANLCEEVGANVEDVAYGMGLDPRVGRYFLKAGIGYGGSCFPKDTRALHWLSNYHDNEIHTIKAAIEVNENQKLKLLKKARKYYESLEGKKVALLGLSFKPGTDDLREAPSLQNIPILLEEGAIIKVYDPVAEEKLKAIYPQELIYCHTIDEALKEADLCFIFTEWPEIKALSMDHYEKLMTYPLILDGRNCYSLEDVEGTGVVYSSIGRRTVNGKEA